ncbi:hypothetical protein GF415_04085 [Candidatus Micrarchaeota archaeon]|nr:hypothetical protein [Candidatus Micrarchaeota archaeon]
MSGKQALFALVAIIGGGVLGYFWQTSRPQDSIEIIVGVSVIAVGLIYFSLHSMSKH